MTGKGSGRRVRAVVLDWAGTTQDHGSRAPVGAFVEVFKRFGVPVTEAQARRPMGLYKLDHIRAMAADPGVDEEWRRAHGTPCSEADIHAMYEALVPIQLDVLPQFSDLIPRTVETVATLRLNGLAIGSTTGYPRIVGELAARAAAEQGYAPDVLVCADEVPAGRPEPWMMFRALEAMRIYPPELVVKVGDTLADVDEGRNAGSWTVGVSRTGNLVGLGGGELNALPQMERTRLIEGAAEALWARGAHLVVESIAELPDAIDEIDAAIAAGRKP